MRTARFAGLTPFEVYALCRLRVDVFVVEQQCPYRELDERDLEEETLHLWVERDGRPVGYLRMLAEPDGGRRLGRVCVAASARGQGWAGVLMDRALREVGDRRCVLDAQAHLAAWYARWGFAVNGPEFLDDGIPHVPMSRTPGT
jgi:ElaA protein